MHRASLVDSHDGGGTDGRTNGEGIVFRDLHVVKLRFICFESGSRQGLCSFLPDITKMFATLMFCSKLVSKFVFGCVKSWFFRRKDAYIHRTVQKT